MGLERYTKRKKLVLIAFTLLPAWLFLYLFFPQLLNFIFFDYLKLNISNNYIKSLEFFIQTFVQSFVLLSLVTLVLSVLRSYFSIEKTKYYLQGQSFFKGHIVSVFLGVFTPGCSCSAIPFFIAFTETGVSLGITYTFLLSSAIFNEITLVLFFTFFGVYNTIIFLIAGTAIAVFSGMIIDLLKLEDYVEDWVYFVHTNEEEYEVKIIESVDRIRYGFKMVKENISKTYIYILIGIFIGSIIYGFVPESILLNLFFGKSFWVALPVFILLGFPLNIQSASFIPILASLVEKGLSFSLVTVFILSLVGLLLPELKAFKNLIKPALIYIYVSIVLCFILFSGIFIYIFSV